MPMPVTHGGAAVTRRSFAARHWQACAAHRRSLAERLRMSPSNLLWGLLVGSMVIGVVLLLL